jgi:hypothetical protein
VSYSWFDPHFAVLYARREEERLTERLATRLRGATAGEPAPSSSRPDADRPERHVAVRGGHLRPL